MTDFECFVNDAKPRLWRAFLGSRGVECAEEAMAEALTWAWENRERLLEMDNPVGYLYRVGLTRSAPRKTPELPRPVDIDLPDIEPRLIPALLDLTDKQRGAVWLVHACGWSYADVALALEVGESTVGTHLTRGLTALRTAMEVSPHA